MMTIIVDLCFYLSVVVLLSIVSYRLFGQLGLSEGLLVLPQNSGCEDD